MNIEEIRMELQDIMNAFDGMYDSEKADCPSTMYYAIEQLYLKLEKEA